MQDLRLFFVSIFVFVGGVHGKYIINSYRVGVALVFIWGK